MFHQISKRVKNDVKTKIKNLENEKDIFDQFRESSEDITEQPSAQLWQKLERRLETKKKKSRRPLTIQTSVIISIIALLLTMAITAYIALKQQEAKLNTETQFKNLKKLSGNWKTLTPTGVNKDEYTKDEMIWGTVDSNTLIGDCHQTKQGKFIKFTSWLITKTDTKIYCSLNQTGKPNNEIFELKTQNTPQITFTNKSKSKTLIFTIPTQNQATWQLQNEEPHQYNR
jgi:hypothetical protein